MSDQDDNTTREIDEHSGVETTGHEWDGIKELNNPLPRWWLWIFYATVVWAAAYMVFMPAIPGPPGTDWHSRGLRNHSERANVDAAIDALHAARAETYVELATASLEEIAADPDLLAFALAAGEAHFGDNCRTCHGAGGQGAPGYPNLNDDVWLWGGGFEDIRRTINVGVRSDNDETRFSQMPAFGRDGFLTSSEITDVVAYVLAVSAQEHDGDAAARGAEIFAAQCAACHGADARGDQELGAPNLTDADWLYGGDRETIRASVVNSRFGVMPTWAERLDPGAIEALTVYVAALDGDLEN